MVDGINFNGKVNNITKLNGASQANLGKTEATLGSFGYGFQTAGAGFNRNVIPESLENKFAEVQLGKNNGYTYISENKDFIQDIHYNTTGINSDKILDAEEQMFAEV